MSRSILYADSIVLELLEFSAPNYVDEEDVLRLCDKVNVGNRIDILEGLVFNLDCSIE